MTVNTGTSTNMINLSPATHNLNNLAGLVNINGQGGANTLNAFDQATTFSNGSQRADNLYQDHFDRYDTNARTVFTYSGMQIVNVDAGCADNGDEAFSVISTPAGVPVTVSNAGTSTSYVEYVLGYLLDAIQGPLTIHGRPGGRDLLVLHDETDRNPQTFTVTANAVSRIGAAPITYDNQTELTLYTSNQGLATVNVQSTAAGTFTQIPLLSAGDRATVSAPSIQGALRLESGGAVSVTVDDSGDGMPRTATLATDPTNGYAVNGLAPQVIYLDLDPGSSMTVLGGSGGNTFEVEGLLSGASLSLNGGSGINRFDLTRTAQYLAGVAGPLSLFGSGADTLVFWDKANPNAETYTFDNLPSNLTLATVPVSINFFGMAAVYLETNGMSTVHDPSGQVLVDVPPPSAPDTTHEPPMPPSLAPADGLAQGLLEIAAKPKPGVAVAPFGSDLVGWMAPRPRMDPDLSAWPALEL
jgi:hypothetical protein